MRLAVAIVLMSACGTQPVPPSQTMPDASAPAAGDGGDGGGGAAGTDAALSICDQAKQHSDLAWIQSNIFSASCARSMCHVSDSQAGGLVLEQGVAHDNLVDQPSMTQSGWMRVLADQPDKSYLLVAIGGADGPAKGTMPWAMPALCQDKIDAVRRWIAAGANP